MTLAQAERQLRYYEKLVKRLRQESGMPEAGKEPSLPTSTDGITASSSDGAMAGGKAMVVDYKKPPTLELLIQWAKSRGYNDEKYTREWFDWMANDCFWCDPKTATPLKQWTSFFAACYRRKHDAHGPAKRARAYTFRMPHADNWRGTRPEDIGDVLG